MYGNVAVAALEEEGRWWMVIIINNDRREVREVCNAGASSSLLFLCVWSSYFLSWLIFMFVCLFVCL